MRPIEEGIALVLNTAGIYGHVPYKSMDGHIEIYDCTTCENRLMYKTPYSNGWTVTLYSHESCGTKTEATKKDWQTNADLLDHLNENYQGLWL